MIIRAILIGGVLVIGAWLLRGQAQSNRQALVRLTGLAFGACWIVAVLAPDVVTKGANLLGVGRGTDLVLYFLVLAFLFTSVAQQRRVRHLESRLAQLTRATALIEARVDVPHLGRDPR